MTPNPSLQRTPSAPLKSNVRPPHNPMKKLFPAILASLGIGAASAATPEVKTIDPRTIRFTLPTVAADELQFVIPTKETFEGAPQFHEDVWCQLEFFPKQRLTEIKRLLTDYKSFERKHRERPAAPSCSRPIGG